MRVWEILWWPGRSKDLIVVTFAADGIQQDARVFRLHGNAEIHTATQVVEAADAVYHSDTGEIEGTWRCTRETGGDASVDTEP